MGSRTIMIIDPDQPVPTPEDIEDVIETGNDKFTMWVMKNGKMVKLKDDDNGPTEEDKKPSQQNSSQTN